MRFSALFFPYLCIVKTNKVTNIKNTIKMKKNRNYIAINSTYGQIEFGGIFKTYDEAKAHIVNCVKERCGDWYAEMVATEPLFAERHPTIDEYIESRFSDRLHFVDEEDGEYILWNIVEPDEPEHEGAVPNLNFGNEAEYIDEVTIDEAKHPKAFASRVEELVVNGLTEDEAKDIVRSTPITMEIYYQRDYGFYAVESEACECSRIFSPYTGEEMEYPQNVL